MKIGSHIEDPNINYNLRRRLMSKELQIRIVLLMA